MPSNTSTSSIEKAKSKPKKNRRMVPLRYVLTPVVIIFTG